LCEWGIRLCKRELADITKGAGAASKGKIIATVCIHRPFIDRGVTSGG
jgi:hypothetical protein